ncbi:MAG TPA: SufS family cysteine desulfurase [Fimbriimonadaceae bacterium]|nr:SufS family cysteine desulfurase [Fimbriimonadaceae bacterium]
MGTQAVDLSSVKSEFPALVQATAGKPLHYLDSAATTQRPESVIQDVDAFYRTHNANVHRGVYELSQLATEDYERARASVAAWLNSPSPEQVVFTKGCTESLNLVASAWGGTNIRPGDRVFVSTMEHHSNLVPWQVIAEARGAELVPIPVTDGVELDLSWLESNLDESVKVVALKAVCNVSGTVNPIQEVARLAHGVGAVVVVDAAQALAHQKVDVQEWDADFVAVTAHKAFGPMGVGALYGRADLLHAMPPYQTGGGMVRGVSFERTGFAEIPDRFEAGTPNVGGAVGFESALKFIQRVGIERIGAHETDLAEATRQRLQMIEGVQVHGNAKRRAGIVSFTLDGVHPHDIGTVLSEQGVAVRVGHHCCMPLMERLRIHATVRASYSVYNDLSDVDALIAAVQKAKEILA